MTGGAIAGFPFAACPEPEITPGTGLRTDGRKGLIFASLSIKKVGIRLAEFHFPVTGGVLRSAHSNFPEDSFSGMGKGV